MPELSMLDRLRAADLLTSEQIGELAGLPEARAADPRPLARLVLQRGWLTQLQVNLVAAGRGGELTIGPYVILDRLGEGGIGQVFRARRRHMGRVVALKLMRKERLASPGSVERFYKEIQAAANLSHPNIVQAFDAGQAGAVHFFAMELVEGPDLGEVVAKQGPLGVALAADRTRQAALALHHAHEQGLTHGDVTPISLLLGPDEDGWPTVVKVRNLGLGQLRPGGANATFAAPEVLLGEGKPGPSADVYGLGATLYYLLTGQAPHDEASRAELLLRRERGLPVPVRSLRPDVPPALVNVVEQLLSPWPEARPASAAEAARLLAPFCGAAPPPLPPGGAVPPRALRAEELEEVEEVEPRRPHALALAVGLGALGLCVLVGAVVALVALLPEHDQPPEGGDGAGGVKALATGKGTERPTTKPAIRLIGHDRPVRALAVSPDGRAVASGCDAGLVCVWALDRGELTWRDVGHRGPVMSLTYSRDGRRLFIAREGLIVEHDAVTGACVAEAPTPGDFLSPGQGVALRLDQSGLRWRWRIADRATGAERGEVAIPFQARMQVHFHDGAKQALIVGEQNEVQLINLVTTKELARPRSKVAAEITSACWGADASEMIWGGTDGTLHRTSLASGTGTKVPIAPHRGAIRCLAVDAGARHVLSGSDDGAVYFSDLTEGQLLRRLTGHAGAVRFVLFGTGERPARAVSAGDDGAVWIWPLDGEGELPPPRVVEAREAPRSPPEGQRYAFRRFGPGPFQVGFAGNDEVVLSTGQTARRLRPVDGTPVTEYAGHQGAIAALAVSPDGKRVVTGSEDGTVRIFDTASGRLLHSLEHEAAVGCVAFSPDGRTLATGAAGPPRRGGRPVLDGGQPLGGDHHARAWDVESGRRLAVLTGAGSRLIALTFLADGRLLGSCFEQPLLGWDVKGQRPLTLKAPPLAGSLQVAPMVGARVALGGAGGVVIWDVDEGKAVRELKGPVKSVSSLLSLGGGRLVAAGRDDEPRLYLWAGEGTNPLTTLALPRPPAALALTPSGSLACLAEADGTVRVISLEGLWPSVVVAGNKPGTKAKPVGPPKEMPKVKLPPFTGHTGTVNTVAYSSDGKMVLTGGADGTARLWDAATGEELVRINHDKVVYCARFRAKDRTVLTLGTGPDAKVWDVEDGTMLHRLPVLSRQQPVIAGDASSEGDDVIAAVGKFTFHYRPGPRDVAIPRQRQAHPAEVTCVAYAPGATHYAVGLSTGVVQIYAVGQARELASFPAHKGPVTSLAWSPKDLRLVSGGQDRTMVLRSLKNLKFYRKFTGHDGAETGITLSPDGKHFASSSKNRTVRLWEPGGRQSRAFKHENPIQGVAFSPNGARLAACGEGGLVFHDLAGGKKAVKGP